MVAIFIEDAVDGVFATSFVTCDREGEAGEWTQFSVVGVELPTHV